MDLVLSPPQTTFSPVENSRTRQQKQPPITSARSGSVTPNDGFFYFEFTYGADTYIGITVWIYTITKNVLLVTLFVYYHCRFVLILHTISSRWVCNLFQPQLSGRSAILLRKFSSINCWRLRYWNLRPSRTRAKWFSKVPWYGKSRLTYVRVFVVYEGYFKNCRFIIRLR